MLQVLSIENLRETLSAAKRERHSQSKSGERNGLSPRTEMIFSGVLQRLSVIASEQLGCAISALLAERLSDEGTPPSIGREPLRVLLSVFDEPLELLVSQELSQELARAVLRQEPGAVLGVSSAEIRTAVSFLVVAILSAQAHFAGQRVFLSSVETVSEDLLTRLLDPGKGAVAEVVVLFRKSRFRLFVKLSTGLCKRLNYYARLCAIPPSGKTALTTEIFSAQLQLEAPIGSALSLLMLKPGILLHPTGFRLSLSSSSRRLSGAVESGDFESCDEPSDTKLENTELVAAVLRLRCRV